MKKFGLVLPDGEATKRFRDNWETTFGKKQPIEVKENPLENSDRRFGVYNAWRMGGMTAGILLGGISLYFLNYPKTFKLLGALLLLLLAITWRLPIIPSVHWTTGWNGCMSIPWTIFRPTIPLPKQNLSCCPCDTPPPVSFLKRLRARSSGATEGVSTVSGAGWGLSMILQ